MATTNYLVTGAARGIGRALVAAYLLRPNSIVIAGVRDVNASTAQALKTLPVDKTSKLILIQIDSTIDSDAASAVRTLQETHGIKHLDVVIANAAIATSVPLVHEVQPKDLLDHYKVNVIGPVTLFAATRPLQQAASSNDSTKLSKFILVGSTAGSISTIPSFPVPNAVYGSSKAAVHYITVKINAENSDIVGSVLHPGWLQTDMGNFGAKAFGYTGGQAPTTVEEALPGILKVIDEVSKEKYGGELVDYKGTVHPW